MISLKKLLILGGSALALAACAGNYDIDAVKNMPSKGSAFQKALHMEYVGLALMERDESDWGDAEFFNTRAMEAANGAGFGPQNVSDRAIPEDKVRALSAGRARLINALQSGNSSLNPKHAARAQAMFDCWMQEQEENFQPKDIAYCFAQFQAAMKKMAPKPMKMAAAKPMAKPAIPGPFKVYFSFNSDKLDSNAMTIVSSVVEAAKQTGATSVILGGHADRAGKGGYNKMLSQKRIDAVVGALTKSGFGGGLSQQSFGETKPDKATKDGAREQMNRRVEIQLRR